VKLVLVIAALSLSACATNTSIFKLEPTSSSSTACVEGDDVKAETPPKSKPKLPGKVKK